MTDTGQVDDECARLKEIDSFKYLETEADPIFRDTAQTLVALFGVDIAYVCFIGRDTQYFLSEIGLNTASLPRAGSFCDHAILQDTPLCVPDALEDSRFRDDPLVTGTPHVRFYAGAPLITRKGYRIGTVSVAGPERRLFGEHEQKGLAALARLVIHQIENLRDKHERNSDAHRLTALFDDVANVMSEGLAVFDAEDRLVYCNRRYREYYDKDGSTVRLARPFKEILEEGLRNRHYLDAIGREDDWLQERLASHAHPAEQPYEQRLTSSEWLLVSEKRLPDGGIMEIRTDITARREREREIRESEKKFRDYTQTASDWIWETDSSNRMSQFAGNHRHLSGIDRRDVLGKTRNEVASEDTTTEKWQTLDALIRDQQPFREFTYRLRANDGSEQVISISGVPFFDDQGVFQGYRGTGRRITEAVRAREQLQSAEARVRAALENTLVGMVLIDKVGTVLEFNREAERMFQYRADEVVGRNVAMLMPFEHSSRHDDYLSAYKKTGEERIIGHGQRLMGQKKDGTQFPLTLGVGRIDLAEGIQFIGSLTDLTEHERLENQLHRAQKLEAIGLLTGGIAHDFNNLLGIIMGNLELGLRKAEPGTNLESYFAKAHAASRRASKITQQLLTFSRQKDYYAETVSCDLNEAIENVEALLRGSIPKSIDLTINPASGPLIANVDMGDLQDVVINLAVNARDAMQNSGRLTISLDETVVEESPAPELQDLARGHYGRLTISDTGPGIPEEIRSRIFEPFFTTKPKDKGTGLGLAMVYGFVKRSRGEVRIYSEPAMGTSFRIYLPLVEDGARLETGTVQEAHVLPRGSEHILIVDDEAELAAFARATLEELGYCVTTCHSPAEALSSLRHHESIDLLFTDIVMPGALNGIELCRQAKSIRPGLKTLLTSGFPGEGRSNLDTSEENLLVKPYTQSRLAAAIRRNLDEGGKS
ncbi:PAS domain S-box protein [Roseibium sp. Sym1]|uniref:PAS domain S-box protein n=1 Tax=Roseibium sp. Sym1 TaxID=3016006 RepID=UPI0022B42385|nr:PAS domain S-box protein [Roseibium sp. Sym1]